MLINLNLKITQKLEYILQGYIPPISMRFLKQYLYFYDVQWSKTLAKVTSLITCNFGAANCRSWKKYHFWNPDMSTGGHGHVFAGAF